MSTTTETYPIAGREQMLMAYGYARAAGLSVSTDGARIWLLDETSGTQSAAINRDTVTDENALLDALDAQAALRADWVAAAA